MRLDYLIAHTIGLSRKQAKKAIVDGQITIEGISKIKSNTQIQAEHSVYFNGLQISMPHPRYYMLHKPAEYICSTQDPHHESVLTLFDYDDSLDLHIVGRLDLDSTGLLLLTNDGQWSHKITSPKKQCCKIYLVHLADPITQSAIIQLQTGIQLKGETKATLPATVDIIDSFTIQISITEGRYHQVKRMLVAVNNHVKSLHRLQVGKIKLDSELAIGQYRPLTEAEINSIR